MRFKQFLEEQFLSAFSGTGWKGANVRGQLFKNPSRKEFEYVKNRQETHQDDVPAFLNLDNGDLYIFTPYLLHSMVANTGKIPKGLVGIRIFSDSHDCEITVTDYTQQSPWFHNSSIANAIHDSYLSKLFQIVGINYFDENIVGDWSELEDDE